MNELLATKLYVPRPQSNRVSRPHLTGRINAGLDRKLTLVAAPAGFGKTTLLSEWVQHSRHPVTWLSLDEGDNDPPRFWMYFVAALQKLDPRLAAGAQDLLRSSGLPALEAILTTLVNEIAAFPRSFAVVLDDYHVITSAGIDRGLAFMLDHQPPNLHIVISTRTDPGLPISRLRARGQLVEIRGADLRFSLEEASLFLGQVMGLDLSMEDVNALEQRTEGWIAGLQMAGLSMQGRADQSSFVQAFSGSHHFILDYLVEEVISRQPGEVQRFLLRTSILDRLTGSLCSAVLAAEEQDERETGQGPISTALSKDSQEILEYLERSNLFLTPLDDEHRWYRYHHLFADLLRARLQHAEPGLVPRLHLAAAGWFEQNGFISEAVQHAFAAKDDERAADLIEEHGHRRWSLSDTQFLSLVGRLPAEVLHARPSLGIYQAWTTFISGQYEAAESLLTALLEHLPLDEPSPEVRGIRSFADLLMIYIAEMSGKELAVELPDRQALNFVPEHHLGMRNSADVLYAFLLDQRGDFTASEELFLRAARRDMAANGTTAVPICITRLARNWILQGRLRDAAELCRKHIDYVRERGEQNFFIAGNLYLVLSSILREWNDLEGAEQMIQAGIQANEPWRLPQVLVVEHLAKARFQQARRDLDAALAGLDDLERRIEGKSVPPDLVGDLRALKIKLWLAKGDRENAWSSACISQPVEPFDFRHELDHILLARLILAEGRPAQALELLDHLARQAESGGRFGRLLEIRLLEGQSLNALKQSSKALEKLEDCLAVAEPEGYLRVFLDEGEPVRELLSAYLREPAPEYASYARRILQAFNSGEPATKSAQGELIEALTRRELEVLELLCAGNSNQEIAEQLFITVSAVKKHTGNIYGKLGVSSRTQASARARQLNLLPSEQ